MFRRPGALGLVAVGVLTIACSDNRDNTTTAPQSQLTGLQCKPSKVVQLTKDLFGPSSTQASLAQQLTNNQSTNVPILFQLFAEVAALANATPPLTAEQRTIAANLSVQGIACGDVIVSDAGYTGGTSDVATFETALGPTGAYEVRGLDNTNADILSHNAGTNTTGASGIRGPFQAWFGGSVLFYMKPRTESISAEAQANPDAVIAADWFTVKPTHPVATPQDLSGIVAICVAQTLPNEVQFRVQQEGRILPVNFSFDVCSPSPEINQQQVKPRSFLGSLAWIGRNFFAPKTLHATSLMLTTSPGGTAKKYSPHEVINPVSVNLTLISQARNGVVNQPVTGNPPPDVRILATGAQGTPWEGVRIKIVAVGNSSSLLQNGEPLCNLADTGPDGVAHFPKLAFQKPGAFRFIGITVPPSADADVTSFTPDSTAASNQFNIRNSTLPPPTCPALP
jgi:hypothetical protein